MADLFFSKADPAIEDTRTLTLHFFRSRKHNSRFLTVIEPEKTFISCDEKTFCRSVYQVVMYS